VLVAIRKWRIRCISIGEVEVSSAVSFSRLAGKVRVLSVVN